MPDRSNPFKDIEDLFDRMTQGFGEVDTGLHDIAVDVTESDDELTVAADLPGYDREDISITLSDRRLTITAERERTEESSDERYHRRERSHREVRRTVYLPEEVDENNTSASYDNGVLLIHLPKLQAAESEDGFSIDIN